MAVSHQVCGNVTQAIRLSTLDSSVGLVLLISMASLGKGTPQPKGTFHYIYSFIWPFCLRWKR